MQQGDIFYIHSDHRNAPIAVTDKTSKLVWQATNEDFGFAHINRQSKFELNLRLSNQYYDSESGLHYNTNRYYDALNAQYLTPDPLGLAAGPDLFAFALNQPHSVSDTDGLAPSISHYSLEDRFKVSLSWAAKGLPGEIGKSILELLNVRTLAVTTGIMITWAASHTVGAGYIADAAFLAAGYYFLGNEIVKFAKGLFNFVQSTRKATCNADLINAGLAFSKNLADVIFAIAGTGAMTKSVKTVGSVAGNIKLAKYTVKPQYSNYANKLSNVFRKVLNATNKKVTGFRNIITVGGKNLGPCCFVAGTLVATPSGYAAIESLNVGDEVYTKAEDNTGEPYISHVTATHERNDQPIYELKLSQQDFNNPEHIEYEVLKATAGHPFYVNNIGFVSVKDLQVGDILSNLNDNKITKVQEVNYLQPRGKTYNLTVEGGHTFYVGKFNTWVHNVGPCYKCVGGLCSIHNISHTLKQMNSDALTKQVFDTLPANVYFSVNVIRKLKANLAETNKAIFSAEQKFVKGKQGWVGDLETAYGKYYENQYVQTHYKDVKNMSVDFTYTNSKGQRVSSEMDVITKTEVIQLKAGAGTPKDNQIEATIAFAKTHNKKPVWVYNPNLVTLKKVQDKVAHWEAKGWDITVRADYDMAKKRHIEMMEHSSVIKF